MKNRPVDHTHLVSRRTFLKQTVAFSAFAAVGNGLQTSGSAFELLPDPDAHHVLMLGDWGTNSLPDQQIAVAQAMRNWVTRHNLKVHALIMLGDNFYGPMPKWHPVTPMATPIRGNVP
jgi:hypothetical protein